MKEVCSDAQSRLQRLGESLVSTDSLSDSTVLQLFEALEVRGMDCLLRCQ